MTTKKLISFITAIVTIFSILTVMSSFVSAAYSAIEYNLSPEPCYANLSTSSLPNHGTPTQGDTYYVNLAATNDFKLDYAEFYVKAPGESTFTCIYRYDPSGYFRWVYYSYNFTSAGLYEIRIDVKTIDGAKGSGNIIIDVTSNQTTPIPEPDNTISYSHLNMNISSQPCYANLSNAALPELQTPSQGDTYYINLACTTDYKLNHAEFYIQAPDQNDFSLVYQYNPKGYFRWVNYAYTFNQSGTYNIRIIVTLTNGIQDYRDISFYVTANEAYTTFSPVWPCKNANYISTMYRYWNSGNPKSHGVRSNKYNAFDIAGSEGDTIYAVESGTVSEKGYQKNGFGYYVVIKHNNGLYSLYGHMKSEAIVNKGDTVTCQQMIGYMGSTGNSSGNHLHFEMYNPDDYSKIINPWTTYYQGNVNVIVGGNSYKANNGYTDDTYAVEWCNWLKNACIKNKNGDYEYNVTSYYELFEHTILSDIDTIVGFSNKIYDENID